MGMLNIRMTLPGVLSLSERVIFPRLAVTVGRQSEVVISACR